MDYVAVCVHCVSCSGAEYGVLYCLNSIYVGFLEYGRPYGACILKDGSCDCGVCVCESFPGFAPVCPCYGLT